ncbi:tRNA lysidine(34) synthetase TilS, partial [bacterium]|nr:tRNA lysidine(34) synthetase TilS [bacterium]
MQVSETNIIGEIREALKNEPNGSRLLLAVSGGLDSVVMLDILAELASEKDFTLIVGHVNHSLRPESHQDAEFVRSLSSRLGITVCHREVDTPALVREKKLSREAAARMLRYQALNEMADSEHCHRILTAHTADDSAETFLMRFIQSPDWWEWTSIPKERGRILRPMLSVLRKQVRHYAENRGLEWREDSSNQNTDFRRNYLRLKALPFMKEEGTAIDSCALSSAGAKIREISSSLLNQAEQFVREETGEKQNEKLLAIPDIFYYFNMMPWAPVERAAAVLLRNSQLRWPAWRRRQVASFMAGRGPKRTLVFDDNLFLHRYGSKLVVTTCRIRETSLALKAPGRFLLVDIGEANLSIRPNDGVLDKGSCIR